MPLQGKKYFQDEEGLLLKLGQEFDLREGLNSTKGQIYSISKSEQGLNL